MKLTVLFAAQVATFALTLSAAPATAQKTDAQKFGARESVINISLSPDGEKVAFVEPGPGRSSAISVATLGTTQAAKQISVSDGSPWRYQWCSWASNTRLVCQLYATTSIADLAAGKFGMSRLIAINADGTMLKSLERRQTENMVGFSLTDGEVIGWPKNDSDEVLISRQYLPEMITGTSLGNATFGLGVDRVNTLDTKLSREVQADPRAMSYIVDDQGQVRVMEIQEARHKDLLSRKKHFLFRKVGASTWKSLSKIAQGAEGLQPAAVDAASNSAYAYGEKDARVALYKVRLDDSLESTLMLDSATGDVEHLLTFGRSGRVFGADIVTDKRETIIFDPAYQKLAAQLSRALPGLPLIRFVDASRDESKVLLFAGSDIDPGRYYVFDKVKKAINEITLARPQLDGVSLSPVKMVSVKAKDGTLIPAYLTLPAKGTGKGLPAIVMPHGGPSSRDEWGFDWMAQYYASQGYAVLQPNFRGSSGYGETWYVDNGFKSWRVAIGDVNDAGRWMVEQGIADKGKLAIVGWLYGGYAALQTSVVEPDLFKAIVAVAPVTDLRLLVDQRKSYQNNRFRAITDFVGSGEHIVSGSPLKQISAFKAPVLMFSGDMDANVDVSHAKKMDEALKAAGKSSELILYKGLDHQLEENGARADMLQKSLDFLQKTLGTK